MELDFIKWGFMAALGVFGWLLKSYIQRVETDLSEHKENHKMLNKEHNETKVQMQRDLTEIKVTYVQKADFETFENRLWERFDRIEDKLDSPR